LPHYFPAEDVLTVIGMTDPPEIYVEETREIEIDCPGEENETDDWEMNLSFNDTNGSNGTNGSTRGTMVGDRGPRCRVNITVNVSLNTTDMVQPITNLIAACSRGSNACLFKRGNSSFPKIRRYSLQIS